jgi:Flp pilus assembly protein TadD
LESLAHDDRANAAQLARAGSLLLESGAANSALELAGIFGRRYPSAIEAPLLEAEACIQLRRGHRAEQAISMARELQPENPEPDVLLARLREAQGDLSGATSALGDALKKDPKSLTVARRQGFLLSQSGRLDDAAVVLSRTLNRKFDAETAAELAFVRYRQERVGEAMPLLKRALKEKPHLARAHYYLGGVLYRQGDLAGAEKAYREADQWSPEDPLPLIALCQLLTHQGRQADLDSVKATIKERFPENAAAHLAACGEPK